MPPKNMNVMIIVSNITNGNSNALYIFFILNNFMGIKLNLTKAPLQSLQLHVC